MFSSYFLHPSLRLLLHRYRLFFFSFFLGIIHVKYLPIPTRAYTARNTFLFVYPVRCASLFLFLARKKLLGRTKQLFFVCLVFLSSLCKYALAACQIGDNDKICVIRAPVCSRIEKNYISSQIVDSFSFLYVSSVFVRIVLFVFVFYSFISL